MTLMFDPPVILQGEIRYQSLRDVKGLSGVLTLGTPILNCCRNLQIYSDLDFVSGT